MTQYLSLIPATLIPALCILYAIAKFIDYMYVRKDKPTRTVIKCPVKGRRLMDHEVFNGHCAECPLDKRKICTGHITAQCKTLVK